MVRIYPREVLLLLIQRGKGGARGGRGRCGEQEDVFPCSRSATCQAARSWEGAGDCSPRPTVAPEGNEGGGAGSG